MDIYVPYDASLGNCFAWIYDGMFGDCRFISDLAKAPRHAPAVLGGAPSQEQDSWQCRTCEGDPTAARYAGGYYQYQCGEFLAHLAHHWDDLAPPHGFLPLVHPAKLAPVPQGLLSGLGLEEVSENGSADTSSAPNKSFSHIGVHVHR